MIDMSNTNNSQYIALYEQLRELTKQYVEDLCKLTHRPKGWLPHIVYVEEEGDYPVYTRYMLEEINPDGTCTLVNQETNERFTDRSLYEINIDWLDTVYRWYFECCAEQGISVDSSISVEHQQHSL